MGPTGLHVRSRASGSRHRVGEEVRLGLSPSRLLKLPSHSFLICRVEVKTVPFSQDGAKTQLGGPCKGGVLGMWSGSTQWGLPATVTAAYCPGPCVGPWGGSHTQRRLCLAQNNCSWNACSERRKRVCLVKGSLLGELVDRLVEKHSVSLTQEQFCECSKSTPGAWSPPSCQC